jgi:5-methylcytosine-specific restriction endonuclease McrA
MKLELLSKAARLTNQQLTAQVTELARHEREATAGLVACLAEFGARKLHLGHGCATMFTYCTEVLRFSEHEAYLRITAARLAQRFPVVLEKLESGTVNLTTLKLLRKLLTTENHATLLAAAEHKSKREVEELVARVAPQPAVKPSIRKVPAAKTLSEPVATSAAGLGLGVEAPSAASAASVAADVTSNVDETAEAAAVAEPWVKPAVIVPLAPELYKIQFTASAETRAKLRRAQDLMRHQIPTGDPAAIIDRALTMLVAHLEKTRLGVTSRPRTARPTRRGSRHIPAAVRRTTWERDGGRCAFVSTDGKRCTERGFFQFHHVHPHGDGGESTITNIELRCRAHNQYEADLYFGPSNDAARQAGIQRRARKKQTVTQRPTDGSTVARESSATYGLRWWSENESRRRSWSDRRNSVQAESPPRSPALAELPGRDSVQNELLPSSSVRNSAQTEFGRRGPGDDTGGANWLPGCSPN